MTKNDHN